LVLCMLATILKFSDNDMENMNEHNGENIR